MNLPEAQTNIETLENLLKMASGQPEGCFAEIGVAAGGVSVHLYQLAEKQNRQLHLFDLKLDDDIKLLCPKAILHPGKFPGTWDINNVAFCFFDIADPDAARFLIERMPTDFVKKGIALFYPYNARAIDYKIYPDWAVSGRGNMRYPYIENR